MRNRDSVLEKLAQQDVGSFVVRDSTTHAGCYALSIRVDKHDTSTTDQGISHYLITRTARGTVKLKVTITYVTDGQLFRYNTYIPQKAIL